MDTEKKVHFAEGAFDNMEVVTSIFSPVHPEVGVVLLSDKKDGMFILHILELAQDEEEAFFPIQELAAFSFGNKKEMKDFIERLPEMSGLEMLMMLNPLPRVAEGQQQQ